MHPRTAHAYAPPGTPHALCHQHAGPGAMLIRWGRVAIARVTVPLALVATSMTGWAIAAAPAAAVQEVQIIYGALEAPPIALSDLEAFARTGIPSRDLQLLLNVLRIDEAKAHQALTQNVLVDVDNLRDLSDSFAGQFLWRMLATTLTLTDAPTPAWEVLRNAVLDTAASGQLTLLDVLRTIEATSLRVDGRRVMAIASQIDFNRIADLASILLEP